MNQEVSRKAIRQGLMKWDKVDTDADVDSVVDTLITDFNVEFVVVSYSCCCY
jgi:hypothetical protein